MNDTIEVTLRKRISYLFLTVVIFLILAEIFLRGVYLIKHYGEGSSMDPRVKCSVYAKADWANEYFVEFEKSGVMAYEPFIEWRRKGFEGKYINISPEGIRKTWNPYFSAAQRPRLVYCFGGSAMWGSGARDEFTIPSLLSKKLNKETPLYSVVNLSESGYTFTQEIIYLILLLKEGERPDYVIFLDGINDIYAAYQTGKAGQIQNLESRRERLTDASNLSFILKGVVGLAKENLFVCRAIKRLNSIFNRNPNIKGLVASTYSHEKLTLLAEKVVPDYIKNVELANRLSNIYGFQCMFILQPLLYTKTPLTSEEFRYGCWNDKAVIELSRLVYGKMRNKKIQHFYDISDIFNSKDETIFMDFAHPSEKGNGVIADEIYRIIKQL